MKRLHGLHVMRFENSEASGSLNVELLFWAQLDFQQITDSFLRPPLPLILQLGVGSFVILTQLSENYIVRKFCRHLI